MTGLLPGIGGTLFPGRFLQDGLDDHDAPFADAPWLRRRQHELQAWWRSVEATCGPATGLYALFDLVAMPLAAMLGYRAHDASFESRQVRARLVTRTGTSIGLLVRAWASGPSLLWRDAAAHSRDCGGEWCMVFAPPWVSIVDTRGHGSRRSVDFRLPDALDIRSVGRFLHLASADVFDGPDTRIDQLVADGLRFQNRVRDDLQRGVADALASLTRGHRDRTRAFDEALTIVYRILFLLFAESRDLVPRHHPIYAQSYAVSMLCREALDPRPAGLDEALAAVTRLARIGCRTSDLIVRPFNGELFAARSAPSLERPRARRRSATAAHAAVREALVALGTRPGRAGREDISYADLGVEQLGSVYERVLDIVPEPSASVTVTARRAAGRGHSARRKETGTFYTPQSLAAFVVRRTLAPLVAGASSDAILALRVVDPSMGSGAFLVAACRYLAEAYERALVDEGRLAPGDLDETAHADHRRLVAERCLAGVDLNPVAVQVARLSLWLASLARGKPLGFLDHRLRVGDSLVGASPDDLWRIRDRAARADRAARGNRAAQGNRAALPLFEAAGLAVRVGQVARPIGALLARADDTVNDVRAKEAAWRELSGPRSPIEPWRLALSLWCARWFWPEPKTPGAPANPPSAPELRAIIDALVRDDRTLDRSRLQHWIDAARTAADDRHFFHWPLEFPDVFYDADGAPKRRAGFDAVVGNPPWEMLRRDPRADRGAPPGERSKLARFIRECGHYGLSRRGHLNLYLPFVERALELAKPDGRLGLVLPWGLAVDDGASALRSTLVDDERLDTVVGLDNVRGLFPIHRGVRFMILVAGAPRAERDVKMRCGVATEGEIARLPARDDEEADAFPTRLTKARARRLGGDAMRLPDVRDPRDLALLERLVTSFPPVGSAAGLGSRFGRDLNATDDRASFGPTGLPVIEGKNLSPFGVDLSSAPHHITREEAGRRLPDRRFERARLAYRDVSGVRNRVSLIAAVLPEGVVSTHTVFCLRSDLPIDRQHFLCALFNSYVLNAIVRMLMGGHLTTGLVEGLPAPEWTGAGDGRLVADLAAHLSAHWSDAEEAELQARVANMYGVDAGEFERIVAGFPGVPATQRRKAIERRIAL